MMAHGWKPLAALTLGLQAALAGICAAQPGGTPPGPSPLYVQIGPAVTVHFEGEQYHRASPPLTGTTFGGQVIVGARVTPVLAVEAEFLLDRKMSSRQSDVYDVQVDYTAESRDTVLGVNLRLRPFGGSRLEVAAGGGLAISRFARRDVTVTDRFFGRGVTRGVDTETTTRQPTVSGSIAVAIPLSPRLELVPAVGARWIERGFDSDAWYLGVGRYLVFFSAALRITP